VPEDEDSSELGVVGKYADAAEGDRRMIEQLQEAGADMSQARSADHYFYFPTQPAASEAARQLGAEGFHVTVRRAAVGDSWLALASEMAVVNEDAIHDLRVRFEDLASALGGEYDGWETAATP
jgi:hypothetical protein